MGRGNWIWLIPMRTEDDTELMSVGIVSRPDVYDASTAREAWSDILAFLRAELVQLG